MFAYILSYLIGEVDTLLANDTATIEEIITTMSVDKNEKKKQQFKMKMNNESTSSLCHWKCPNKYCLCFHVLALIFILQCDTPYRGHPTNFFLQVSHKIQNAL